MPTLTHWTYATMGNCISPEPEVDFDGPGKICVVIVTLLSLTDSCFVSVDFNHFHILRAIGKGAFGKVSYYCNLYY